MHDSSAVIKEACSMVDSNDYEKKIIEIKQPLCSIPFTMLLRLKSSPFTFTRP